MQRCPKCFRTYQNDTQKYCTACGGRLVPDEEMPTAYGLQDAKATYSGPAPRTPPSAGLDPNQTMQSQPLPSPPVTARDTGPTAFDPHRTVANVPPVDINQTLLAQTAPGSDELSAADTLSDVAPTIAISGPIAGIAPPLKDKIDTAQPLSSPMETTMLSEPPPAPRPASVAPPVTPAQPPVTPPPPMPAAPPVSEAFPARVEAAPPVVSPPVAAAKPAPAATPSAAAAVANAPAKSKLPLILGILLGLLVVLGVAGGGLFLFVIKPRLEARNTPPPVSEPQTPPVTSGGTTEPDKPAPAPSPAGSNMSGNINVPPVDVVPPNSVQFVNKEGAAGSKLAPHFVGFSFYYPKTWTSNNTKGTDNFADLVRKLPDGTLQEVFTISWYDSQGTFAADQATFQGTAQKKSDEIAKQLPDSNYQKVKEGPTKISGMDAYEFRFKGEFKGTGASDGPYWGRVVFLPTDVASQKNGVTMIMLVTSKAPEVKSAAEVGEKGDLPVLLTTFRFAPAKNSAAADTKRQY